MDEATLISRFVSAFPKARVPVGIGDDAAVLAPHKRPSCVTTDALVEGVHFTLSGFSLEEVGHKAMAVNLSDLAAMGAKPTVFVCALGVPAWMTGRDAAALGRGMARLAQLHKIELVGGNVSRSDRLSVTLTAFGELEGKPLLRSGAKAGDLLYVSGVLGDARLGLEVVLGERPMPEDGRRAVIAQRRPVPRVALGQFARAFASAAIDLSDGLCMDAPRLALSSGVRLDVTLESLPMSGVLRRTLGEQASVFALVGGEDYELLLTVPKRRAAAFEKAAKQRKHKVTRIGEAHAGTGARFLKDGKVFAAPKGFDHLSAAKGAAGPR